MNYYILSFRKRIIRILFLMPIFSIRHKRLTLQFRKEAESCTTVDSSNSEWSRNIIELKNEIKIKNPISFLSWDVVRKTMFINQAGFVLPELEFLKSKKRAWKNRWKHALKENRTGYPENYIHYPLSSGNLIHHTYHIAQLEAFFNFHVDELNLVLEFGGGYGSMSRLFKRLGFKGEYLIYDLPEFNFLQKFYLSTCKLMQNVFLVSNKENLRSLLIDKSNLDKKLFIATWSLSESPKHLRIEIMKIVNQFDFIFIAYQKEFNNIDNDSFFNELSEQMDTYAWHFDEIQHLKGHHYLYGKKIIK